MWSLKIVEICISNTRQLHSHRLGGSNTHIKVDLLLEDGSLSSVNVFGKNARILVHCVKKITHVLSTFESEEEFLWLAVIDWMIFPFIMFKHDLVESIGESNHLI